MVFAMSKQENLMKELILLLGKMMKFLFQFPLTPHQVVMPMKNKKEKLVITQLQRLV